MRVKPGPQPKQTNKTYQDLRERYYDRFLATEEIKTRENMSEERIKK